MNAKFIAFLLVSFSFTVAYAQTKADKVSGWIQLQPKENFMKAQVTYTYINDQEPKSKLDFFLDKEVKVTSVTCADLKSYTLTRDESYPLADLLNTLSIKLQEPLQKNDSVTISLSYQANTHLNRFGDIPLPQNWIEVGFNGLNLTPVRPDLKPNVYDMEIKADPAYQVYASGQVTKSGRGNTRIQSDIATMGVNFILGKDLQTATTKGKNNTITIVSHNASDSLKKELTAIADWCLNFYNRTFGTKSPKHQVIFALRPVKDLDASYAVGKNYVVSYDSKEDFFRRKTFHLNNLSHEISHFWWQNATSTSTHNWLNEGFADYVCLMAMRAYFGKEEFNRQVKMIKANVAKLPDTLSLANYDARGKFGTSMSYNKGAYLLYQLEERIGEAKFIDLLTEVAERKVKTGDEFINVVAQMLGEEEAQRVRKEIRNE